MISSSSSSSSSVIVIIIASSYYIILILFPVPGVFASAGLESTENWIAKMMILQTHKRTVYNKHKQEADGNNIKHASNLQQKETNMDSRPHPHLHNVSHKRAPSRFHYAGYHV